MSNTISIINRNLYQNFPYHLVNPSNWPILVSFSLLNLTIGAVAYMHGYPLGGYILSLGLTLTVTGMLLWFRDVITEATFLGDHTIEVQKGLMIGFILFIISEVFAFLSVFWAFFHSSLSPAIEIGGIWPPQGITALDPFAIPLLNTFLLLSSGAFITWGHHALIQGDRKSAIIGTFLTIVLAVIFTALQYYEYSEAAFNISDSVFGTVFYASTGLHGLLHLAPTKLNKSSSLSPARSYKNRTGAGQGVKIRNIHYNHPLFGPVLYSTSPDSLNLQQNTSDTWLILTVGPGKKKIYINKKFLEWLVGFTDAEGNFNISLRNFKNNSYNSLVLTFQIGLHIDDLEVLKFIQKNLQCGKISISGNKCNFFVNDRAS